MCKMKPSLNGKTPLHIDLLALADEFEVEMVKLINESKQTLKDYLVYVLFFNFNRYNYGYFFLCAENMMR